MRHGKKINHLGRKSEHRNAMLSNMASSLILHKRITTTVAKAKALRKFVEPLITKSKDNTTHSRRVAFSYLQSKEAITELFSAVAEKVAERPGGYTRIIRTGNRLGDNAETCMMELVDFNELLISEKAPAKAKTRRTRRAGKAKAEGQEAQASAKAETPAEEKPATETPKKDDSAENKASEE
jgi:large subunit ribosomal protein L17